MKKIIFTLIISTFMVSCANIGHPMGYGPLGAVYTNTKQGISGNNPGGTKTAKACNLNILNYFTFSDTNVMEAMTQAKIKTVTHINKETFWILVFGKSCTVIHGN